MALTRSRYLGVIFGNFKKRCVDVNSRILVPWARVYTTFNPSDSATYCNIITSSHNYWLRGRKDSFAYRITFGGEMVARVVGLPNSTIDATIAKNCFNDTVRAFKGFYYHEAAHLRYTDMSCKKIIEYPEEAERHALHELFNIFEDIVIERFAMSKDYPYTRKYFKYIESKLFSDEVCTSYKEENTAESFFNYLLLRLRRGTDFKGKHELFDKNSADMLKYIRSVLSEKDGTKRIDETIAFFDYLKTLGLDMKAVSEDFKTGELIPFGFPASSSGSGSGGAGGSGSGKGAGGYHPIPARTEDEDVNSATSGSSGSGGAASGGTTAGGTGSGKADRTIECDPEQDCPITENDCYESFNQKLGSDEMTHTFYDTSYFEPDGAVRPAVEALLMQVNECANGVATVIKTYQSRNRLRYHAGKSSGKLHVPSAIAGKPVNVFKRKERIGLCPDLAISVLCDNSGSMHGEKSEICTLAMLALASACDKANVPIEVNAFTEADEECVTIQVKQFKDSFEKAKPYFGITSGSLNPHYETEVACFTGNVDEINLYNVWREYRKQPWKDKVMIVISDGYTCGSTEDLRRVTDEMAADGIYVIGIGVCTDAVRKSYEHYKMFPDSQSLTELPEYLSGVLTNLIKG